MQHRQTGRSVSQGSISNRGADSTKRRRTVTQFDKEFFEQKWAKGGNPYGIARILAEINPNSALDVGCSFGSLVVALRGFGIDARGVDISEYAIDLAPPETKKYLMLADAESFIPFPNRSFDLVTSIGVLPYLEKPSEAIREIYNVLKTKGVFVPSVFFKSRYKDYKQMLSAKEWQKLIEAEGFVLDGLLNHRYRIRLIRSQLPAAWRDFPMIDYLARKRFTFLLFRKI